MHLSGSVLAEASRGADLAHDVVCRIGDLGASETEIARIAEAIR